MNDNQEALNSYQRGKYKDAVNQFNDETWKASSLYKSGAIDGDDDLVIRTELDGGVGKYGRLLGWCYIGDSDLSLNEMMIAEGYAHAYDGGTKNMDLEALREIRRSNGTLNEG